LQEALRADLDATGDTDPYVNEELAECLLALGRPHEAAPHFARAHAALVTDRWVVASQPGRLERLRELAGDVFPGHGSTP